MNRQIKFRAKTIIKNVPSHWIVGDLLQDFAGSAQIWVKGSDLESHNYLVDANTIGQFTGFKDYNGVEICDGDIVEYTVVRDCTQKKIKEIHFDNEVGAWYCGIGDMLSNILFEQNNDEWKKSQNWTIRENQYVRVIGNIHENPEMLK